MRKLKTKDLFALSRCLRKMGIKDEIKKISMDAGAAKDIYSYGYDLVYRLFEMATEKNGEEAVYEFLSGPFEMTPEEVSGMDIDDLFEGIKKAASPAAWKSFFTKAASLMK